VHAHACGAVCMQNYVVSGNYIVFSFLQNYTVEVLYSPVFIVPLTETMFLTPTFRNVFPITDAHIPRIRELQHSQHKVNVQYLHRMIVLITIADLCSNSWLFEGYNTVVCSSL
jgi:hypothetical protein